MSLRLYVEETIDAMDKLHKGRVIARLKKDTRREHRLHASNFSNQAVIQHDDDDSDDWSADDDAYMNNVPELRSPRDRM